MARQRLGVALLVPGSVAREIDGLRRALGDGMLARIPPHLTLVPPVNVREPDVPLARERLRAAAGAASPLRLQLGPAATFHPETPVVYLQVAGDAEELRALRDGVLQPPLARAVTRPFVPHVTVADDMAPERIPAAIAALADFAADVVVDRVHLLREDAGRVWWPVADAPLARPAVVGRGGLALEIAVGERPDPEAERLLAVEADAERGPQSFAVTARCEGRVVGVVRGARAGPVLRVDALAVAAEERRQGVARHLLAAVEQLARDRDCRVVRADVPDDPACSGLFGALGWRADAGDAEGGRRWHRTVT